MKRVSRTSQVFAGTDGEVRLILIFQLVIVVAGLGAGLFLWVRKGQEDNAGPLTTKIKYPEVLLLENFQRPMDRDLTEQLIAFERTGVSKFIDVNLLKPFFDDVNTRRLTVEGVEVRPEQFPDRQDLQRIVDDCARILGIPKPRVYIRDTGAMNAYATNMAEPVIVV